MHKKNLRNFSQQLPWLHFWLYKYTAKIVFYERKMLYNQNELETIFQMVFDATMPINQSSWPPEFRAFENTH